MSNSATPSPALTKGKAAPPPALLVRVALPLGVEREFEYLIPAEETITRGMWVEVVIHARRYHGVIVDMPAVSSIAGDKLKFIARVRRDLLPLSDAQLELAKFLSDYYQAPFGQAVSLLHPPVAPQRARADSPQAFCLTSLGRAATLPPRATLQATLHERLLSRAACGAKELYALGGSARAVLQRWLAAGWIEPVPAVALASVAVVCPELNTAQAHAVAEIGASIGRFAVHLLHGVTGSGKTAVYLQAAAQAIARRGQVLMLVPEINLTPQLVGDIEQRLPGVRIAILHSGLSARERFVHWRAAAEGEAQLIVGTRLAVLVPLLRLALIIVDEEHDSSFKQQDGVRYHARDVAIYRARLAAVTVVLGSATPALETYHRATQGPYHLHELPERAAAASMPAIRLVAQRNAAASDGLTATLLSAVEERLARGEQALVFINRRGYAPSLLCAACGWAAPCPRCSARLVVHLEARRLRCHHCGLERPLAQRCPDCGNQDLQPMGFGTQRLEARLRERFPRARILRIDRDSTRRRHAWRQMFADIQRGEADILVGTQMLAKGHDFPKLTLVGILGADNALYSADFRATERVFAQLLQVAGRAGRATLPGEVIVQTDHPTHPVYEALVRHDYPTLVAVLLRERAHAQLPPFSYLALLHAEAHERNGVDSFLADAQRVVQRLLKDTAASSVHAFPPVTSAMAKRAGYERGQMLLQAATRKPLLALLRALRPELRALPGASRVRWSFDVDPLQLD